MASGPASSFPRSGPTPLSRSCSGSRVSRTREAWSGRASTGIPRRTRLSGSAWTSLPVQAMGISAVTTTATASIRNSATTSREAPRRCCVPPVEGERLSGDSKQDRRQQRAPGEGAQAAAERAHFHVQQHRGRLDALAERLSRHRDESQNARIECNVPGIDLDENVGHAMQRLRRREGEIEERCQHRPRGDAIRDRKAREFAHALARDAGALYEMAVVSFGAQAAWTVEPERERAER